VVKHRHFTNNLARQARGGQLLVITPDYANNQFKQSDSRLQVAKQVQPSEIRSMLLILRSFHDPSILGCLHLLDRIKDPAVDARS
jgi:hypothetical protein